MLQTFEYACSCVRNVIRLLGSNLYISLEGKRVCVSISLSCDLRPHVAPIRSNQKAIIRAWRWVGGSMVWGALTREDREGCPGPVDVLFTPTCAKISLYSLCQPEVEILTDCFCSLTSGTLILELGGSQNKELARNWQFLSGTSEDEVVSDRQYFPKRHHCLL